MSCWCWWHEASNCLWDLQDRAVGQVEAVKRACELGRNDGPALRRLKAIQKNLTQLHSDLKELQETSSGRIPAPQLTSPEIYSSRINQFQGCSINNAAVPQNGGPSIPCQSLPVPAPPPIQYLPFLPAVLPHHSLRHLSFLFCSVSSPFYFSFPYHNC